MVSNDAPTKKKPKKKKKKNAGAHGSTKIAVQSASPNQQQQEQQVQQPPDAIALAAAADGGTMLDKLATLDDEVMADATKQQAMQTAAAKDDALSTGVYKMLLETRGAEELCQGLQLKYRHIARLKKLYAAEDMYGTNEITEEEFFHIIHEEKRKLTAGMFKFSGLPAHPKRLTFDQFVICVVTMASLTRRELLHYAFMLFDEDESGAMDGRELRDFCRSLENRGFFFKHNVEIARSKMMAPGGQRKGVARGDGLVDFEDLAEGNAQFPAAFYPILQFQYNLRRATLGESVWTRVVQHKVRLGLIVAYMRTHNGHLPPMSLKDQVLGFFDPDIHRQRKLAINRYAQELRHDALVHGLHEQKEQLTQAHMAWQSTHDPSTTHANEQHDAADKVVVY
ncbi:TPA: hypothetical protein N0F65_001159 [Lagenidium giganteum]|uniref:EF-hand domain-containing protein n=1 Tax=Lagenidium giganteum TaxID=4803 RepID=A0AAV2YYK0_9STRA|nr:TPA: hypothetical protein N0F65_001159 [Lagenidium giganteum]